MSSTYRTTILGDKEWQQKLRRARPEMGEEVEKAVLTGLIKIEGATKDKLDNDVLNRRTSTLFRSIHRSFARRGLNSWGAVGTPVKYAKTHEFGLRVEFPKRGISIKFTERPFLRPSLDEFRDEITDGIRGALQTGLDK